MAGFVKVLRGAEATATHRVSGAKAQAEEALRGQNGRSDRIGMLTIIGIFTQVDDAEICLNNLAEADFQSKNISVVMKDPEEAKKISDTSGEFTGLSVDELIDGLVKLGLPKKNAKGYKDIIEAGGVFIAVSTANKEEEEAVREILKDQNGKLIKRV